MIKIRKKSIYPYTYEDILNDESGQSIYHIEDYETCVLIRPAYNDRFIYWVSLEDGDIEQAIAFVWEKMKFRKSDKMLYKYFPEIANSTVKIKSPDGPPILLINGTIILASREHWATNKQDFISRIPM
jgi:hypothetical protein